MIGFNKPFNKPYHGELFKLIETLIVDHGASINVNKSVEMIMEEALRTKVRGVIQGCLSKKKKKAEGQVATRLSILPPTPSQQIGRSTPPMSQYKNLDKLPPPRKSSADIYLAFPNPDTIDLDTLPPPTSALPSFPLLKDDIPPPPQMLPPPTTGFASPFSLPQPAALEIPPPPSTPPPEQLPRSPRKFPSLGGAVFGGMPAGHRTLSRRGSLTVTPRDKLIEFKKIVSQKARELSVKLGEIDVLLKHGVVAKAQELLEEVGSIASEITTLTSSRKPEKS